jgi:transglutaminase-like putative cysteine protease
VTFNARQIPHTLSALPSGDAGVAVTLKAMVKLIRAAKVDPSVRQFAASLVQGLPQKDLSGQMVAIFNFVRDRIRYLGDVRDVETLQTPQYTLELKQGDCDDKSVLLATLLETISYQTLLKAVGVRGGPLSHVYVQVKLGKKWISLDATMPNAAGWEPPDITSFMYAHV